MQTQRIDQPSKHHPTPPLPRPGPCPTVRHVVRASVEPVKIPGLQQLGRTALDLHSRCHIGEVIDGSGDKEILAAPRN